MISFHIENLWHFVQFMKQFFTVVGACRPTWREVDDDIMQNSQVIVDTIDGANKESGDIILSKVLLPN